MADCIPVAILAAGASSRLGQPKQLVCIDGEPLLRRAARIAIAADVGPVHVVLGCHAGRCAQVLGDLPVSICMNRDWPEGLASSIRAAVNIASKEDAAGLMILQADQYRLSAPDLKALNAAWLAGTGGVAVRAGFETYLGPPAIFPALCFQQLLTLDGDCGARKIFNLLPPERITTLTTPTAVFDLDTPAQLEKLSNPR